MSVAESGADQGPGLFLEDPEVGLLGQDGRVVQEGTTTVLLLARTRG